MSRYKLISLILEQSKRSKAIIMAGSSGSGKSTFINDFSNDLKKANWQIINADSYVEDKESPFYNNLSKASNQIRKVDLPKAISSKNNFLYDTTGSNLDTFKFIQSNKNYDVLVIMLYTHPFVSFLRNFKRERKVPTIGVLTSWNNVYKNIDNLKSMFGENFILVQSPTTDEEKTQIKKFDDAVRNNNVHQFFTDIISGGMHKSTFRKNSDKKYSPDEISKMDQALQKQTSQIEKELENISTQAKSGSVSQSQAISKIKNFIWN